MLHKQPEGEGCLWTINSTLLWFICYILHSDWSLLLFVCIQGSLHCKQGILWEASFYNMVYVTESTASCQYIENKTHAPATIENQDEVENLTSYCR